MARPHRLPGSVAGAQIQPRYSHCLNSHRDWMARCLNRWFSLQYFFDILNFHLKNRRKPTKKTPPEIIRAVLFLNKIKKMCHRHSHRLDVISRPNRRPLSPACLPCLVPPIKGPFGSFGLTWFPFFRREHRPMHNGTLPDFWVNVSHSQSTELSPCRIRFGRETPNWLHTTFILYWQVNHTVNC